MKNKLTFFLNYFLSEIKKNNFSNAYQMLCEKIKNSDLLKDEKKILTKIFFSFNKYYFDKEKHYRNFEKQFLSFIAQKKFSELISIYKYIGIFDNIKLIKYKKFLTEIFLDKNINFKNKYFFLEILKHQKVNNVFIVVKNNESYLINPQNIKIIKNSLIYLTGKQIIYQCFYNLDQKKYLYIKTQYLIFLYDFYPNIIDNDEIKSFVLSYIYFLFKKKYAKTVSKESLKNFLIASDIDVFKYLKYFNKYYDN